MTYIYVKKKTFNPNTNYFDLEELELYLNDMVNKYMKKCIVVYVDELNMAVWEEA